MPRHKRKHGQHHNTNRKPKLEEENHELETEALAHPDDSYGGQSELPVEEVVDYYEDEDDDFTINKYKYSSSSARISACFYPKFDNEKSDQEVRTKMIEMVSTGQAILEVTLKHSGSLFMYAGHQGGAYAKNSFRNIYTAVGVFVLGRMLRKAWGSKAFKKQEKFNKFLEGNHLCVSMELVTAVLGDHGERPREDYVVVTAVAELGNGQPRFYSTPDVIAFCRKWQLPTNHVWLFSTKKSVASFFAAFDALYEEGTATPVCKVLDEVADISIPGSIDHVKTQGEILEGLVGRIVSRESSKCMEEVLKKYPLPDSQGSHDMGPSLREFFAANTSGESQQIEALLMSVGTSYFSDYSDWLGGVQSKESNQSLVSKFLEAPSSDYSTTKLKELIHVMKDKRLDASFKCYCDSEKTSSLENDNLHFKLVIHVYRDSAFLKYQKETKKKPGLWPLYRGFFIDVNLSRPTKGRGVERETDSNMSVNNVALNCGTEASTSCLADEDVNLMIKLKFLKYKLRTFLIRNGLKVLFEEGPDAYREYYLRQMDIWNTSYEKQREVGKLLDEWAVHIENKYGDDQLSTRTYLSEAEPFLEQYAKRSPENLALIGYAGNLVRPVDFLPTTGGRGEAADLDMEDAIAPSTSDSTTIETIPKNDGLIVFFPGIPGCAKSLLCKEILKAPGGLGDGRPVHSLMGDLIKGKYWKRVADERMRKPYGVTLADKNAPNKEVWDMIEDMCTNSRASAVPVITDCEGEESNPFSLDALAVFMFRVLQRVNHPGNLDKASPVVGYVLLMFYHLYEGKNRKEFEAELLLRFGTVVKVPLFKAERSPLPSDVKSVLDEGISLYNLHTNKHGRLESTKGSYWKDWADWEERLRIVLSENANYFNSIQVPFDFVLMKVLEQLRAVANGDCVAPISTKRKMRNIMFSAITLHVPEIIEHLNTWAERNPKVKAFIKGKDLDYCLQAAHLTLAHKNAHGVAGVASYGEYLQRDVPIYLTALLFSEKTAALEASVGEVDGEKIVPKTQWPHVTIWSRQGVSAKEANKLPQLFFEGKATRIDLDIPATICGIVDFY